MTLDLVANGKALPDPSLRCRGKQSTTRSLSGHVPLGVGRAVGERSALRCKPTQGRTPRGFTLIELLVVMMVVGVLLAIAAPRYVEHVDRSREVVLKHNLAATRQAIDRYYADRGRYPEDLAELVRQRYLREIPIDPMTERYDAWVLVPPPGQRSGAQDLRSSAPGTARDGRPYAAW